LNGAGAPAPRLLGALVFLSGATGLCYEVLWARMLGAQFGVSIFGVAATVAAFMLGLGLGAIAGALLGTRAGPVGPPTARRALRGYALLELLVAAYALALPAIDAALAPALEGLAAHLDPGAWLLLQGAVAIGLLALPATAIGAGFPLALRAFAPSPALLGRVYGLNCLGGAAGALACVGLLAALGWAAALYAVAGTGALVAVAAWGLSTAQAAGGGAAPTARPAQRRPPFTVLLGYAAVGAAAMMLEIAWTRLYGMVMLRTEYVLGILLAVYLLGTAAGSLLAGRMRTAREARSAALAVPAAACGFTLIGLWALPSFSVWIQDQRFPSLPVALAAQALALCLCTLPTTVALGAWLPLLSRRLAAGGREDGGDDGGDHIGDDRRNDRADDHDGALLYGVNCLGAAAGAIATISAAIALLGTTASIALAAVLLLALAPGLSPHGRPSRMLLLGLPLAAAAAWSLRAFPPPARLLPGSTPIEERMHYEDALALNDVTEAPDGQRTLMTDLQHLDASSDPAAVQIQADQARLALLLHPGPRSVLFLGLGTGISASGSLAYPDLDRTAVEISAGAIAAARDWFAPVNGGILGAMTVQRDDAHHYLSATRRHYDVIVGDLFHPDLAGMGNLLSVEQFARARARLADGGIFVQWIALNQFDREALYTALRSFQRVFPDAQMFLDGMHLALVGSTAPLDDGAAVARNLARRTAAQQDLATGGEGAATWLGRYWGPIAAGTGPVESERRPVIAYRLPRLRYAEDPPLAQLLTELLRRRPDLAVAQQRLDIAPAQSTAFQSAYVASDLAVQSWVAALGGNGARARQLTQLAYETNPADHWIASDLADDLYAQAIQEGAIDAPQTLERILRIYPQHMEALRALWHRERAAGRDGPARAALARLRAAAPLDREAAGAR
jgi:spermidine synthase